MDKKLIAISALVIGLGFQSAPRAAENEVAAGNPAPVEAPPAEKVSDNEFAIVLNSQPMIGRLIFPATESGFKFKLKETGDIVEMKWKQFDESEQRRIKKACNITIDEKGVLMWGDPMTGVRLMLENGRTIDALPIPDRNQPGMLAFRTAKQPLMLIRESEIKTKTNFVTQESFFFSPQEAHERWLLEKPAKDASDHLEYARRCDKIGLFDKAMEHLAAAKEIDPRTADRNQEFLTELIAKHAEQRAQELYSQALMMFRGGDWFTALDLGETVLRNFPNYGQKSRVEAWVKNDVEPKCKMDKNKRVVLMSYAIADQLLQKQMSTKVGIDAKGNIVPSIPGKQVMTKQGHVFRGVLVNPDDNGDLVIRITDKVDQTLKINGKDVLSVIDINMSIYDKLVEPTFDQLKEYVTDVNNPECLKGQMLSTISKRLRLTETEVKEIFDNRLQQEARYEDGRLVKSTIYASEHEASYGKGSWLREGAKPDKWIDYDQQRDTGNGGNTRQGLRNRVQQQLQQTQQNEKDNNPDSTDDPLVWWKFQPQEVRYNVLRGMMAEKVFKPMKDRDNGVKNISCSECSGRGQINMPQPGGNTAPQRCPSCRGITVFFKIKYN